MPDYTDPIRRTNGPPKEVGPKIRAQNISDTPTRGAANRISDHPILPNVPKSYLWTLTLEQWKGPAVKENPHHTKGEEGSHNYRRARRRT